LDQIAYRLSIFLNDHGFAAIFLPRDGYGSIDILIERPVAAFSHVFAGKYAGLGTIGFNHMLINEQYGPRARYVSVLTNLELAGDPMLEVELCRKCLVCQRLCPSKAFSAREDRLIADMDKHACACYHRELRGEYRYPCGVCAKTCPIGQDRKLYESQDIALYLKEPETLSQNPDDPRYQSWVHCRRHGSGGSRIL
jgi:epoxyqueuosine reductase QueG